MIHLMLNDLRLKVLECLLVLFELLVPIFHYYNIITLCRTLSCQWQASFFYIIICLEWSTIFGFTIIRYSLPICATKIVFRTPIIFAAMPTQRSAFASIVSSKSRIVCWSFFVADSDFWLRKIGSVTISFIVSLHLLIFTVCFYYITFFLQKQQNAKLCIPASHFIFLILW